MMRVIADQRETRVSALKSSELRVTSGSCLSTVVLFVCLRVPRRDMSNCLLVLQSYDDEQARHPPWQTVSFIPPTGYSCRKASMGSSRAALRAGK